MQVSDLERSLGITAYYSSAPGVDGRIKAFPEDFVVQEILLDGSRASLQPQAGKGRPRGRYTICVLAKRSRDTFLTLEEIAQRLRIARGRIGFGGIKDARALTAQYVSFMDIPPERITEIRVSGVKLHPVTFAAKPIKPDQIWGNDFSITVRDLGEKPSVLKTKLVAIVKELEEIGGTPNFFGHQRFGTVRPVTHLVGKRIALRDFEGAVMTFLGWASPSEPSDSRTAREELKASGDLKRALQTFPKRLKFERAILEYLLNHPEDYIGALRRLPLGLRRLFLEAYQSYLFNKTLSRRIELGIPLNRCEPGDCVVPLSEGVPSHRYRRAQKNNLQALNEWLAEAKSRIAIPLIGYQSPPSKGVQADVEKHILTEEGVSRRNFYVGAMEEVSTGGGLRTATALIRNLSTNISLDETDPRRAKTLVKFQLPRGSYATALMREIIKPPDLIAAGF